MRGRVSDGGGGANTPCPPPLMLPLGISKQSIILNLNQSILWPILSVVPFTVTCSYSASTL